jgi:FKBP-type peptidyl-prolyl cis-trans isomerase (trigger factor)
MKVMPAGSDRPYPGLDKTKLAVDTDEDPLGLAKGMHGMAPGDARKWDFNFPDDWHVELWRGQRATADVKLRELFEWDLPEFDDAFVAANYPSFESADDMRKSLLASTALERFKAAQAAAADRIMEAVAACVDIEVPEAYVDAVAAREYQEKLLGMVQAGVATPEQAERMATEEGLRAFIDERCGFFL